jgi:hypothetical protein
MTFGSVLDVVIGVAFVSVLPLIIAATNAGRRAVVVRRNHPSRQPPWRRAQAGQGDTNA